MECGWLSDTVPFDADGNLLGSDFDAANVAFRFPATHGSEIRTCDDFKYGLINRCAADFTPITLPTWDPIAQIASDLSISPREWPFAKAGPKEAYKNLPLNPDQAQYCIVSIRSPGDSDRYGCAHRALSFGAAAAVRHYNCFPRVIAAIINRLFGLPLVNYFDDLGSTVPTSLSGDGHRLLRHVCAPFFG